MKKLTKIYEDILGEALLGEERIEFNQLDDNIILIADGTRLVLMSAEGINKSSTEIIDKNLIMPYILGWVYYDDATYYANEIGSIAAEKGYGLLMYELIMQKSYPKGIISSRDGNTRDGAFRLYQYYYEGLNPNVKVEKIEPNDENYTPCVEDVSSYIPCKEDGITPWRPEFMKLYNSILYMKPNEYNSLIEKGGKILEKYNAGLKDSILKYGMSYFKRKYD